MQLWTFILLYYQPVFLSQRGTPPSEAPERNNSQPHIVLFIDDDEDLQQYFISVEQELMLETSNLIAAVFYCVAAHYIYNLSYHKKAGDFWIFAQEKMLQLPSKAGIKRSPSSVTHFSGISRTFADLDVQTD